MWNILSSNYAESFLTGRREDCKFKYSIIQLIVCNFAINMKRRDFKIDKMDCPWYNCYLGNKKGT